MSVSLHNIQYRADAVSSGSLLEVCAAEAGEASVALTLVLPSGIRRPAVRRTCEICGGNFLARRDKVRAGQGTTCSNRCAARKATRTAPPPPTPKRGHSRRDGVKHPAVVRAHHLVYLAIQDGRLVRPAVGVCGHGPAIAHHEDYAKPLEVAWLCNGCHLKRHFEMGRLGIQPGGATWPEASRS